MFKQLEEQSWLTSGLYSLEAKVTLQTSGKKDWQAYHNYPRIKLGLSYTDYGDPEIFGRFFTGVTGLNYGIGNAKKFRIAPGFGLGYSTRHNTAENNENRAVSTKISFVAELDFVYDFRISEKFYNELILAFRHASNGNIKKPNYGMNFVQLGLSFNYEPKIKTIKKEKAEDSDELHRFKYYVIYTTGWKDPRVSRTNKLYQVQAISVFSAYRFSNVNSFTLGLDGFLDSSQYEEYIKQTKETPPFDPEEFDQRQLAFSFGNIFHFGRLGIVTQAGLFLYRPYDFMKFSYQRYGFQYTLFNHLVLHSALKAYFGSADLVEFGLGVTF
jgi:hypothetical protein